MCGRSHALLSRGNSETLVSFPASTTWAAGVSTDHHGPAFIAVLVCSSSREEEESKGRLYMQADGTVLSTVTHSRARSETQAIAPSKFRLHSDKFAQISASFI